jgi:hypothetical protein
MDVEDHQAAAGAQHPGELGQRRLQVRKVGQGQSADDDVDVVVGHRQIVQVAPPEIGLWHAFAGVLQHVRRTVHTDHPVTLRRQQLGVPPGAAGGVQGGAGREVTEDLVDEGDLVVEHLVDLLVVGRRPDAVTGDGVHSGGGDALAGQRRGVQQPPDLGDARVAEVTVVVAGEGAEQGHAFHGQQVGERALVDHGETVTAGPMRGHRIPS